MGTNAVGIDVGVVTVAAVGGLDSTLCWRTARVASAAGTTTGAVAAIGTATEITEGTSLVTVVAAPANPNGVAVVLDGAVGWGAAETAWSPSSTGAFVADIQQATPTTVAPSPNNAQKVRRR